MFKYVDIHFTQSQMDVYFHEWYGYSNIQTQFDLNATFYFHRQLEAEMLVVFRHSVPFSSSRSTPPDRHGGTVRGWQMPVERKPLANDRSPVFFSAYRPTPPLSDLGLIRHTGCCEMEYVMSTRHSCFRPAPIIGNR